MLESGILVEYDNIVTLKYIFYLWLYTLRMILYFINFIHLSSPTEV